MSQKKLLSDSFMSCGTDPSPQTFVLEQLNNSCGCLFDRRNKKTVHSIFELMPDSADVAPDHRRSFPHRFCDSEPEAFANRFLQNNRGAPLKRIDQSGILGAQDDKPLLTRIEQGPIDLLAFRVVGRDVPQQTSVQSTSRRASLNALITPSGSFQRSNREICTTSGWSVGIS